jgi:CRP-like cAMP-binding protein
LHPLEERLARWLLLMHDRVATDELRVTHEFLALMLGVRRPTVSIVAGTLQHAGLISYKRGAVRILDRAGLEKAACECYAAMRAFHSHALEENGSA